MKISDARDVDDLLGDIIEWGSRIFTYIATTSEDEFHRGTLKQDAVIRCLEVMGEAAGHLLRISPGFQEQHPELALREAYRARNRTAHGYGSVNLGAVWQSAHGPAQEMVTAARLVLAARRQS